MTGNLHQEALLHISPPVRLFLWRSKNPSLVMFDQLSGSVPAQNGGRFIINLSAWPSLTGASKFMVHSVRRSPDIHLPTCYTEL